MLQGITLDLGAQKIYLTNGFSTLDPYAVARAIYAGTKSPVAGPHLKTAADDLAKRFERKPKVAAAEAPAVGNAGTTPSATASAASSMTPPTPHA